MGFLPSSEELKVPIDGPGQKHESEAQTVPGEPREERSPEAGGAAFPL